MNGASSLGWIADVDEHTINEEKTSAADCLRKCVHRSGTFHARRFCDLEEDNRKENLGSGAEFEHLEWQTRL
jgi:hypothetical protein